MFEVNFDYESRLIGLKGKVVTVSIEAAVKKDKIVKLTGWCDEIADYISFEALCQIDQDTITELLWTIVEAKEKALAQRYQRISDNVFAIGSQSNYELVKSLNAERGIK